MEYNEFKANLQKRIQSEYEEAHIYTETIEKNNGIKKERLVIHEKGERAVPGIYLRELYECYKETGDMELCVQMVKQLTEKREKVPGTHHAPAGLPEVEPGTPENRALSKIS